MAPQTVFLIGATGETGAAIAKVLLAEPDKFKLTAYVRAASTSKPAVKDLESKGVTIVTGDLQTPVAELTEHLKGQDVVISACGPAEIPLQTNLVDAAAAAGVKRFVPCGWIPVIPVGINWLRDEKEKIYNRIKLHRLPYTIIDNGWWIQNGVPALPSGKTDYARLGMPDEIVGDGNTPSALTDLFNTGVYVARIIADPRTLNRYVLAYDEVLTHNQVYDTLERLSGEKIERKYISHEEVAARLEQGRAAAAKLEESQRTVWNMVGMLFAEYLNTLYVRGDNTPEYARYLGYLTTDELYPDVKKRKFEDVIRETLDGKGYLPYADRSPFAK